MSPLTKLFVVLLVVLSLLTTAATVVYVNKEDVQKQALENTKKQLDAARAQANSAEANLAAAQASLQQVQQEANSQANAATAQIAALQQDISKLNVDLAKAAGTAAAQQLDISRLTEALNASQATGSKLNDEVARLRGENDKLVQQSADLNTTVADLTNKLDVTERERRLLAEQLTQTKSDAQRMSQVIRGAGLSPQQQEMAVARSGLPAINGVIREVRPIAGQQYATVSVGSADGVQKGMEFKVVDRASGGFLGTLTIDTVEPNEAIGRLFGPNVAAIKAGVEVRTQL